MNDLKGIIEDVEKSSLVSDKVIKKVIEILGQENWNYINDEESDICTTAGELIITLKGIADLEETIANLKEQVQSQVEATIELDKENAELKQQLEDADNVTDCFNKQEEIIAKAKEIIKKFSEFVNNEIEYDPEHPQEHTDLWNKLCEQAEQFLNGSKVYD